MSKLFSPASIGSLTLKNRIIFPSITSNSAQGDGQVSSGQITYYGEIAAGGVAAVTVEAAVVSPQGKLVANSLGLWDDCHISGLAQLVEAIKNQGAAAWIQIAHVGPQGSLKINGSEPLSPSGIPFSKQGSVKEMSRDEIQQTIRQFIEAGIRAQKAGFDAIELHAAHFYLLSSFLSPAMNKRSDEYGGTTSGRTKIVTDIIKGLRAALGNKYPLICRLNGRELVGSALENGIDAAELRAICLELKKSGVDALHISSYDVPVPYFEKYIHVPATPVPGPEIAPGIFRGLAAEVKEYVQIPVITVGRIDSAEVAEEILAAGCADFIAIGRGLIADHELPRKMNEGAAQSTCLYCNNCLSSIRKSPMTCQVNSLPL